MTNAEAGKRAAILEAEGLRESQVRKAEGEKEAAILRAEGLATARLAMAQAEAEAIQRITASLPEGQAAMYLLGTEMDFVEDRLGAAFKFTNPNEAGRCGCGPPTRRVPSGQAWRCGSRAAPTRL